jgi:hypothetical protein
MNLTTRIERLEEAARWEKTVLPDVLIRFVKPVMDEDGRMRVGQCTGGIRMRMGGEMQWLDGDMNPVAG